MDQSADQKGQNDFSLRSFVHPIVLHMKSDISKVVVSFLRLKSTLTLSRSAPVFEIYLWFQMFPNIVEMICTNRLKRAGHLERMN